MRFNDDGALCGGSESSSGFKGLYQLREEMSRTRPHLDLRHLSMGMTNDFEIAIEEGATLVRVGSALFSDLS